MFGHKDTHYYPHPPPTAAHPSPHRGMPPPLLGNRCHAVRHPSFDRTAYAPLPYSPLPAQPRVRQTCRRIVTPMPYGISLPCRTPPALAPSPHQPTICRKRPPSSKMHRRKDSYASIARGNMPPQNVAQHTVLYPLAQKPFQSSKEFVYMKIILYICSTIVTSTLSTKRKVPRGTRTTRDITQTTHHQPQTPYHTNPI